MREVPARSYLIEDWRFKRMYTLAIADGVLILSLNPPAADVSGQWKEAHLCTRNKGLSLRIKMGPVALFHF